MKDILLVGAFLLALISLQGCGPTSAEYKRNAEHSYDVLDSTKQDDPETTKIKIDVLQDSQEKLLGIKKYK